MAYTLKMRSRGNLKKKKKTLELPDKVLHDTIHQTRPLEDICSMIVDPTPQTISRFVREFVHVPYKDICRFAIESETTSLGILGTGWG